MTLPTEQLKSLSYYSGGIVGDLARELLAIREVQPYGYLRENDGRIQISIGAERPYDRAGGYATPWAAIYARAPAPVVVKLPTEFYSDQGMMIPLEKVMAALAVVGVRYERKGDACQTAILTTPEGK